MILFYHKKIYTIAWMSLERGHVSSERCLFQKIVYMVLLIRNTHNRQIYRDRMYISDCSGIERRVGDIRRDC